MRGAMRREIILEMRRCDIDKMAFHSYPVVLAALRIQVSMQECRATHPSNFSRSHLYHKNHTKSS
jgi:hypothetical protein